MEEEINISLVKNRQLFLEIHRQKAVFIQLFSELANNISEESLMSAHPQSKGIKISKGNELGNCPYQVLDLIRDFNKHNGLNIRLLNWWGQGLYLLIYYGAENIPPGKTYTRLMREGFEVSRTGSPWDYQHMIIGDRTSAIPYGEEITNHTQQYHHLQLIKPIPYLETIQDLKSTLLKEIRQVLKIHQA